MDKRVIVYQSDEDHDPYPNKEVILITPFADIVLDTREGFLRFLAKSGVRATNFQVDTLLDMRDEEFWRETRLACSHKCFPDLRQNEQPGDQDSTFMDLYQSLFRSFEETFVHYNRLTKSYQPTQILASVARMMANARKLDRLTGLSAKYRALLSENLAHANLFACQLAQFLDAMPPELTIREYSEIGSGTYPDRWGVLEFFHGCTAHQRDIADALRFKDIGDFGRYVLKPTTLDLIDLKNMPIYRVVLKVFGFPAMGPLFRSMGLPWH
ncbi:MAG: hypothetical protein M3Y27_27130 [Acidobacteriota bacterium]|nr:hypothetical protein [Acidobacteriota bacterium]